LTHVLNGWLRLMPGYGLVRDATCCTFYGRTDIYGAGAMPVFCSFDYSVIIFVINWS
jgi:hypothetical protein